MLTFQDHEKKDFRLKLNKSPPRVDTLHTSCDFNAVFCIIYCDNTKKIAFELDEKYIQLPSFHVPSLQCTEYARYIGISNILI